MNPPFVCVCVCVKKTMMRVLLLLCVCVLSVNAQCGSNEYFNGTDCNRTYEAEGGSRV